jgi:hypothetical protein
MTAQKSGKDFWTKMLSAAKVKRILESRGFDVDAFRKDYLADTNRGPRKATKPTDQEISAVESFLKNGDYEAYLVALDTTSRPKADSALRRVVAWQSQNSSTKSSSRRKTS